MFPTILKNEIIQSLIQILTVRDFSAERLNPYPSFEKLTAMISQDAKFFTARFNPPNIAIG